MPKHGREHAYGPYENRNGWRIVLVGADGARLAKTFKKYADAQAEVERIRGAIDARTLEGAVTDYLEAMRAGGARVSSLATTRIRLSGILRLKERDRPLRSITPRVAAKLYAARIADGVSVSTHRGELSGAVRLFEHCRRKGWIAVNPWEEIEPVGTPLAGKPQLRLTEARQLLAVLTRDESPEATAVMMCLLMGLRAHEVIQRVGRDVDDNGRLLWIPTSKTAAGVRQLVIPSALRGRLLSLVRGPEDRLFALTRFQLWTLTVGYCKAAGVPRVTPHGLRGTFATLAVTGGMGAPATLTALAPQFGHGDNGATMRRHYLAPGAEQTANVVRLETILQPEETSDVN